ncbi:Sodium/calcium exchanger protein-domain-containing protein [Crucibulum laeve]|uniref:Vacuolar calcium ion transporter n=1 Tax=Crucibulum laeve TaxID=68775 RepID=A0A5C3M0Y6_9AGAR|nr:Sodium/calcium exchanger protein-domain-containing protein [Crucibulum laeve]
MGETFASPSHNASNTALPQPTPLLAEDDDEPPSSGPSPSRPPQVDDEYYVRQPSPAAAFVQEGASDGVCANNIAHIDKGHKTKAELALSGDAFVHRKGAPADLEKLDPSVPLRPTTFRPPVLTRSARVRALFTPSRPLGPRPTYHQSFMAAVKYTPLNLCLLFIPVSWALHYTHQSDTLIFVFSALGIIPLAALLGLGTEQIALRTSQSVGGLLNATLGNVIEMIIAGIALKECQLELVQSSLLGGLLSNLLLVLGCAFIVGGFRFHQQEFQPMVAQLNSSLLIVSVISLIVPAAFHEYLESRLPAGKEVKVLLELSRGSAIILILIYVAYLFFQFYSHNHLFLDTLQTYPVSPRSSSTFSSRHSTATLPLPASSCTSSESSSDGEQLKLNTPFALLLLGLSTAFAYLTAEHLVGSLEGMVAAHPNISKEWITLIIIPVISNAAEHTTAVIVASKGKFDLAMSVAVGSCIQIALFVIPMLVLVAWGMGKPLTLLFDPLETIVLFFSVLIVKFSVEDGKSHWMSGLVLMATYILIGLAFWNFPETVRTMQGQPLVCV